MEQNVANTFRKEEKLCGKKGIERLLAKGRHGSEGPIRYTYIVDNGLEHSRVLISVPKRLFKRAVKRNLLKRRIRECWRKNKGMILPGHGIDILLTYSTKEVLTYQTIYSHIENTVAKINNKIINSAKNDEVAAE